MFEIDYNSNGDIYLAGRLDASQSSAATVFLDAVVKPSIVDFARLEYISSAGLGVLLATQQRLVSEHGSGLRLINLNKHVADVFRIAGFDRVIDIDYGE